MSTDSVLGKNPVFSDVTEPAESGGMGSWDFGTFRCPPTSISGCIAPEGRFRDNEGSELNDWRCWSPGLDEGPAGFVFELLEP